MPGLRLMQISKAARSKGERDKKEEAAILQAFLFVGGQSVEWPFPVRHASEAAHTHTHGFRNGVEGLCRARGEFS